MKVLVTGNLGYIGAVLVPQLIQKGFEVVGYDTEYYDESCQLYPPLKRPALQICKDIREVALDDLQGVDAVIHLAALSNDPLGELDPKLTEEINLKATLKLAALAKQAKVERFIYVSSQSMYGISNVDEELDEDRSLKNPVTAYAKTKWEAECGLKEMQDGNFHVICFRPSTVFGASPKLRCDIVYNNLVASAYTRGKIEIKSDGTPWRPVVHIQDVSNALIAGLKAPLELVRGQAFNVGIPDGNFTVRQLAEAAQKVIPEGVLTFSGEHGSDSRTYRVSFNKILTVLKNYYRPEWDLVRGGKELVGIFKKIRFQEDDFLGKKCNRLVCLKDLQSRKKIDTHLRWL